MKDIINYEGFYKIDRGGNVFSVKSNRIIKPWSKPLKYLEISLSKNGQSKRFSIHRLVAMTFIPKEEGKNYVDHINRDPSDNRIENLRWCSLTENQMNKKLTHHEKSSKYKGVSYDSSVKKWVVWVSKDKKQINIGRFLTEDEAAKAYNEFVKKEYGDFAVLNEF